MFVLITFLSQVILTLIVGGIIFAIFTVSIEQPLIGAVLGLAIPFIFFWRVEWRHFFASQKYRRHNQIKVSPQGVETSGHVIPLDQVTHLELRAGGSEPEDAPIVAQGEDFPTDAAKMVDSASSSDDMPAMVEADDTLPAVADPVRGQLAERSYLLTMRPRQSSELKVLAGGLTLDCGQSLVHDLSQAIKKQMPVQP